MTIYGSKTSNRMYGCKSIATTSKTTLKLGIRIGITVHDSDAYSSTRIYACMALKVMLNLMHICVCGIRRVNVRNVMILFYSFHATYRNTPASWMKPTTSLLFNRLM